MAAGSGREKGGSPLGEAGCASGDDAVLATIVLAARDDEDFRKRLLLLLRLPDAQRAPLVRTAVEEMSIRGEAPALCQAFLRLADADVARKVLSEC